MPAAAWREVAGSSPWLRAPDRQVLEIYAQLLAEARADFAGMPASRMALLSRQAARLGLGPHDRTRLTPRPEPSPELSSLGAPTWTCPTCRRQCSGRCSVVRPRPTGEASTGRYGSSPTARRRTARNGLSTRRRPLSGMDRRPPGTRPPIWWRLDAPEELQEGESEVAYLRRHKWLCPGRGEEAATGNTIEGSTG